MKALFAHGAHDLRLTDCDARPPGRGEVLVRLDRGGICGSDLHYFHKGGFGTVKLREPMILGHEVAGFVAAVGPGVSSLAEGDLVAVSPSRPCGACSECLRGLPNQCLDMRFYGSAMPFPHIQGAFREELAATASQCVPANGLSPAEAAMAEPLSVALHAVRRAGEIVGRRVIVTGCGPIGVLVVLAARAAGAAEIIATDITGSALDFARIAGADVALDTSVTTQTLAPYTTGKGTLDILFECSGAEAALRSAIPAIRPRGRIVQLGLSGDMSLPMMQITAKEIELTGSFRFHEEFTVAVQMIRSGAIDVKPFITHSFPLAEFETAFATASDRNRSMKVQLEFA